MLPDHPDLKVEIINDSRLTDIVAERFDPSRHTQLRPTHAEETCRRRFGSDPSGGGALDLQSTLTLADPQDDGGELGPVQASRHVHVGQQAQMSSRVSRTSLPRRRAAPGAEQAGRWSVLGQ